jgi:putative restriction endonuclease
MTGSNAEAALEAAHIIPYRGKHTNHATNGLLLRGDLHTLFDLGLVAVDTATMTIVTADSLKATTYSDLAGKSLLLPDDPRLAPSTESLDQHRARTGL